jgi:tRNA pseudouridine38-40 synthase
VDAEKLRRAANDLLPPDIHVLTLAPAPNAFHARHSAISRSYVYQISRRRTALAKRWVWWVKRPLDERRMGQAASLLPGRHDFRLFCEKPNEQPSTLVVVESIELDTPGALILIRLSASHFLWKMVRRVVGTLVKVGAGELDVAGFEALLAGKAPRSGQGLPAEWTAPPSGLFLERVLYPGDPPLGELVPAVPVPAE